MKLLYVANDKIAEYKKAGWVLKSKVSDPSGNKSGLMLKLQTIGEFEKWDFESKCVRT